MQMKDVSDDELRQLEKNSRQSNSNPNEVPDSKIIDMVQQIKEGKNPVQQGQQQNQNIVEPEMPRTQEVASPAQFTSQMNSNTNTNSNFWKINGLPSKGKFYSAGTEILGRPMKVLEVKKVSSLGEENGDFILNDIVRRTTTGIVHDDLYVADKLYILFWLRANTYRDSGYVVPFICQKCEKKSEYHFELDNLEVQQISDDFDPNKEIKLINDTITYDYLRIKDELFIDRFKELNYNTVGDIDDELLAMAQMIKTINGKEQTLLQKYHWIIELEPGDYSYLRTYMEKKGMGIKPFVNITCKQCGGTAAVAVSFRSDFFIPEYKFE